MKVRGFVLATATLCGGLAISSVQAHHSAAQCDFKFKSSSRAAQKRSASQIRTGEAGGCDHRHNRARKDGAEDGYVVGARTAAGHEF